MMDFDSLLETHQSDPAVRTSITKIMGAPNPSNATSEKVKAITVKKVIDVHNFMLDELQKLEKYMESVPNKASWDTKTVTISAQAFVGSKVQQKFAISSEEIEQAVLLHHAGLSNDQAFLQINI